MSMALTVRRLPVLLVLAALAGAGLPPAAAAGAGAGADPATPAAQRQMSPLGLLPATFIGESPGAGGAVRWQIDFLPGGRYQWRQTSLNRTEPHHLDDLGRYTLEGRRIALLGGRDAPLLFQLQDDGALRRVDGQGRPIAAQPVARLSRQAGAAPFEPRLTLTGLLADFADAPRVVLCADGRSLPVATEGDHRAMALAYAAARLAPGAPVWVLLDGLIASRPSKASTGPPQATLVVERFGRVDPLGRCDGPMADRPLLGTEWRLPGSRAGLRFDAGRATGSDGCNRFAGPFEIDGPSLRVGPLAGTKMACPQGQAEADAFAAALGRVRRHAVRGEILELLDAQGATLLRLQAAP